MVDLLQANVIIDGHFSKNGMEYYPYTKLSWDPF